MAVVERPEAVVASLGPARLNHRLLKPDRYAATPGGQTRNEPAVFKKLHPPVVLAGLGPAINAKTIQAFPVLVGARTKSGQDEFKAGNASGAHVISSQTLRAGSARCRRGGG
jgi:hypothetical protein